MTVYFKESRSKWMYNFLLNGKRYGGYCAHPDTAIEAKNKKQARNIEEVIRDRLGRKTNSPAKFGCSLAETAAWHADNRAKHLASWPIIRTYIRELLEHFGAATDLNAITDDDVAAYINWSREQTKMVWMKVPGQKPSYDRKNLKATKKVRAPATINHYLKILKLLFKTPMARKHCKNPPEIKLLKIPKRIPTPIDHASAEALLKHANPHLQKMIILCIHTSMREKEALRLKTSQFIEDQKTIYLDETTKARKGRTIPVNPVALEILKQCREQGDELWEQLKSDRTMAAEYARKYKIKTRGDIPFILFRQKLPDGKRKLRPLKSIATAWIIARKKAGLEGKVRFDDTRASFCSYLAQLGVNILDIQQLAGHESIQTTMRYISVGNTGQRAAGTCWRR